MPIAPSPPDLIPGVLGTNDSPATARPRTFLFLSQVYLPDPAAVGQHLADAAEELVRRGHRVIVYTSDRGYDDPSARYARHEICNGVEIRRVPFSSFGKSSIAVRLLGGVSFIAQVVLRSLLVRHVDAVVVSTSPPMASLGSVLISLVHRARVKFWVMDVNPDQMVALGILGPRSVPVRVFDSLNRLVLRRASDVVVLDRFMADRMNRKLDVAKKISVLPPWPASYPDALVPHIQNPFRAAHGLDGKIVVMYSGNHGPSSPVTTIIEAAKRVVDEPRLVFMFIGGGIGKREVEEAKSPNVVSLPYQPLDSLANVLSAADVHVVTVGDGVQGIVHPSKVYGAMGVGRPILLVGPDENHVTDILSRADVGWHIANGDVDGAVKVLRSIAGADPATVAAKGKNARELIQSSNGKAGACGRLCDVLERGL